MFGSAAGWPPVSLRWGGATMGNDAVIAAGDAPASSLGNGNGSDPLHRALGALAGRADLAPLLERMAALEPAAVERLLEAAASGAGKAAKEPRAPKALPEVNGDFFDQFTDLPPEVEAVRQRVRAFMEAEVAPIANDLWERAEFPRELIPKLPALGFVEAMYPEGPDGLRHASVAEGVVTMEMARVDPSFATFVGVHCGLAFGSILLCGSPEQQAEWLPRMRRWEAIGSFGLTEPDVGSGVAGGLTTTCRREGDEWVIDGEKKWIGNATFADFMIVWARDVADDQVKGFIVSTDTAGYAATKMEGKVAQRIVQNGRVTLSGVRVPELRRLPRARSFKDTGRVLSMTRTGVAWIAVGCAMGAYERSLAYTQQRRQFGRPLASFQLIQMMLVKMVGHLTAIQALALRTSRMQDAGVARDEHSSLAKQYCAARCREVVALARESLGGNGILLEFDVARFFADAEAIYSYEGSNEINALIVGRAVSGFSAFV